MASFIKSKLKKARDAIGRKEYEAAKDAANEVLSYEPDNYNAYVIQDLLRVRMSQSDIP